MLRKLELELLILCGWCGRERSGASWLHLILRLLRMLLMLLEVLHGLLLRRKPRRHWWLLDEAHHVLLCVGGTGHGPVTEGRLLLLTQH